MDQKTITPYQQVKEFMQTFGQEVPGYLKMPSAEVRRLRAKLILEEAVETISALGYSIIGMGGRDISLIAHDSKPDLAELLDGLCDLDYVARCGTAISYGISEETLKLAQDEVHRSNMSKLWTKEEISTSPPSGNPLDVIHIAGRGHIVKLGGKVIKSPSYSPANLAQFLV